MPDSGQHGRKPTLTTPPVRKKPVMRFKQGEQALEGHAGLLARHPRPQYLREAAPINHARRQRGLIRPPAGPLAALQLRGADFC